MRNEFLTALFMALAGAAAVSGQSALDGFDPSPNGIVRVVVVQPDGRILIGGDFTTLSPNGGAAVARNHIARLNHDGTLDTAFNPNANNVVISIALQADGKILAGGGFTSIGGAMRHGIARLDAATGVADSFDPNANDLVYALAVQADGRILAGGFFNGTNSIGGATRNHIARLNPTTGLADSFDPNANNIIYSIVVQADGKILTGGFFNGTNSIGGQSRNRIARLDPATGLADSFDPNASAVVDSIVVQADGKVLVGGAFNGANSIGGQTRNFIARLDPATGAADSFDPNASGAVYKIAVQADGKVLAGGEFSSIGGQSRHYIARLNDTNGLADAFDPNADAGSFTAINAIALQTDGKVLAGGDFTTLSPNGGALVARHNIARLEPDGRLDRTLNPNVVGGYIVATAVQLDGKILIGGVFNTVAGSARHSIARLNSDGTLDTAFNPNPNNAVFAIAVGADGKILVGGAFNGTNSIGGQARNYIARLNATTGLADSFNPNADGEVISIAVQADGRILAGGLFLKIGGLTRKHVARLDATTGLADSFNANANGPIYAMAVQPDGKILVGGDFAGTNSIGGQTRNRLARLDTTTGFADSFNPNANSYIDAIVVQADGKILVGGFFSGANCIGGATRNNIARLDPVTGLADSFDPNANSEVLSIAVQANGKILVGGFFSGANSIGGATRNCIARLDPATGLADSFDPNANASVQSILVQADGKVLVGGAFNGANSIGGQARNSFARLNNDAIAPQNLAVTQTTITWTLGGSSPQLARVAFESSTNNVNYTSLGDGTGPGTNWILTGLNLPAGQVIYIRARGLYPSGEHNGSETIMESVRNVFLSPLAAPPRPLLNIQLSAVTNVVLSWATNFTGFTLEANPNLNASVWSVVTPAPAISSTNNVVTNAASGAGRFYRLRQ